MTNDIKTIQQDCAYTPSGWEKDFVDDPAWQGRRPTQAEIDALFKAFEDAKKEGDLHG